MITTPIEMPQARVVRKAGQAWAQLQIVRRIKPSVESDWSGTGQQLTHDEYEFAQPRISLFMGALLAQSRQIACRRSGDHIEIDLPAIEQRE